MLFAIYGMVVEKRRIDFYNIHIKLMIMTERMLAFVKENGIEMPIEIEGNPFEGLCDEEILRIQMATQDLFAYIIH